MKADSTKLTVTKAAVERVRSALRFSKTDMSIAQFVENILTEACEAIENPKPAGRTLPTVAWCRQKSGRPEHSDLAERLAKIEAELAKSKKSPTSDTAFAAGATGTDTHLTPQRGTRRGAAARAAKTSASI